MTCRLVLGTPEKVSLLALVRGLEEAGATEITQIIGGSPAVVCYD